MNLPPQHHPRFDAGDRILYRDTDGRRLLDVKPVTVVEDSPRRIALWLPLETPTKQAKLHNYVPNAPREWIDGQWSLVDSVWRWAELLILVAPGARRATWVMWSPDRSFRGWYVNLQSELRRTAFGFDYRDHQLDILVRPDRTWRWKDELELERAVELGQFSSAEAESIWAEGHRAVTDIEADASPFSDGSEHWRPEAQLQRPTLSAVWDDLSMYDG